MIDLPKTMTLTGRVRRYIEGTWEGEEKDLNPYLPKGEAKR